MTTDDPEDGSQQSPFILWLPDELQIMIFKCLPPIERLRAAEVCQKWKRLAFDGSLWAKIDARPFYRTIPAEQLLRLGIAAGKFLREANFRGCLQLTGHGLRTLSDFCPNVHVLQLRDCRSLSTHSITCFLHTATQLHSLDLSCLDTVTNTTLRSVAQLPLLEHLCIAWCRNVSGQGLQAIAHSCAQLTTLVLNGCAQLDEPTMMLLGRNLRHMRHLSVASCTSLTDEALFGFLQNEPSELSHLNVSGCARVSDASLRHIATHVGPHLTRLELAGCVLLTDRGFCFLAPRASALVYLDLEDLQQITGSTVKTLANNALCLQHLGLANCTHIADDAIIHLVLHGICRRLAHLELDNSMLSDRALSTIACFLRDNCHHRPPLHMEVLDCSSITQEGVRSALNTAQSALSIKSFYSWPDDEVEAADTPAWDDRLEERHIPNLRAPANQRTYNTIGRQRRRPDVAAASSEPPYAANCIIL